MSRSKLNINTEILETMINPAYFILPNGDFYYINEAFSKLFEYEPEELIGVKNVKILFHEDKRDFVDEKLKNRTAGQAEEYEEWLITSKGKEVLVNLKANPIFRNKKYLYTFGNLEDILEKSKSSRQYETLKSNLPGAFIETDPSGNITDSNQGIYNLTGFTQDELLGYNLIELLKNPNEILKIRDMISSQDYGGRNKLNEYETRILCKNGEIKYIKLALGRNMYGTKHINTVIQALDITQNVENEKKLQELAEEYKLLAKKHEEASNTDMLTGLPNKRSFEVSLIEEFEKSKRYGNHLSLIWADSDNLKIINDTQGHQAGDQYLKNFATFAKNNIRGTDRVYRYGGDEFVYILPETNLSNAEILAQRICKEFDSEFNGETISLGVGQLNTDKEDLGSLLTRIDDAMYIAKKDKSKSTYVVSS